MSNRERPLWLSVIRRAIFDLALYEDARDLERRRWYRDAKKWLFSDDHDDLFNSLRSICVELDLDIAEVRSAAVLMGKEDVKRVVALERRRGRNGVHRGTSQRRSLEVPAESPVNLQDVPRGEERGDLLPAPSGDDPADDWPQAGGAALSEVPRKEPAAAARSGDRYFDL
tara:strand:- start:90 stop:599 length:510 start_codon:yes stop_codon:yes gene_type:complete